MTSPAEESFTDTNRLNYLADQGLLKRLVFFGVCFLAVRQLFQLSQLGLGLPVIGGTLMFIIGYQFCWSRIPYASDEERLQCFLRFCSVTVPSISGLAIVPLLMGHHHVWSLADMLIAFMLVAPVSMRMRRLPGYAAAERAYANRERTS